MPHPRGKGRNGPNTSQSVEQTGTVAAVLTASSPSVSAGSAAAAPSSPSASAGDAATAVAPSFPVSFADAARVKARNDNWQVVLSQQLKTDMDAQLQRLMAGLMTGLNTKLEAMEVLVVKGQSALQAEITALADRQDDADMARAQSSSRSSSPSTTDSSLGPVRATSSPVFGAHTPHAHPRPEYQASLSGRMYSHPVPVWLQHGEAVSFDVSRAHACTTGAYVEQFVASAQRVFDDNIGAFPPEFCIRKFRHAFSDVLARQLDSMVADMLPAGHHPTTLVEYSAAIRKYFVSFILTDAAHAGLDRLKQTSKQPVIAFIDAWVDQAIALGRNPRAFDELRRVRCGLLPAIQAKLAEREGKFTGLEDLKAAALKAEQQLAMAPRIQGVAAVTPVATGDSAGVVPAEPAAPVPAQLMAGYDASSTVRYLPQEFMGARGVRDNARDVLKAMGGCFRCGFYPFAQTDPRKHGRTRCTGTPGRAVVEGLVF